MMTFKHNVVLLAVLLAGFLRAADGAPVSITVTGSSPGASPFISMVTLAVTPTNAVTSLKSITFSIQPKSGSLTRPLTAVYMMDYLQARGDVDDNAGTITVPVFGLYANFLNTVNLTYLLNSGTVQHGTASIQTAAWNDPSPGQVYLNPQVVTPRTRKSTLSFDYLLLKNFATANSPIIIDSDGAVRWVGTAGVGTQAAAFFANGLYISGAGAANSGNASTLIRQELDGTFKTVQIYSDLGVSWTGHHNIDPGKYGMIMDVNTVGETESVNVEVDASGVVLNVWNVAQIISTAMAEGGDDPTKFVSPTADWFHNNAVAYWPGDNSLVISSRENFVICVDYDTKQIKWILGDTSKAWYTFPSLRKYALTLGPNTLAPIGQHAVSMRGDDLLLFDDGLNSLVQVPAGVSRTYSALRKYYIDRTHRRATQIWDYDAGQAIFSDITSSVYQDTQNCYLVDWAAEASRTKCELMAIDGAGNRMFDYIYAGTNSFMFGWNAVPLHLEHLVFQ